MINEYINKVIKSICNIDVNRLIADLSTRKQEIISLNEQLMHLRNVNNSNTTRIIQLESTIDIQKNKINTLQSLNVELSDMLESNRADISSLQNERNNLFSDIANKLQTINEQDLRNTALQEELNQTKSVLQYSNQENTRLQEFTNQMRNKCSELEQNIQSVSDEKDALSSYVSGLHNQISENNNEIDRLKEKDNEITVINEDLLCKQVRLQEEISAIRAEKDALIQKLEEERIRSEQQLEEQRQTIESLSSEKVALITLVDTLQNSIADYENKLKTLEEENNQQSVSNEELLTNHTLLQEKISIIDEEKDLSLQQDEEEAQISGQQVEELGLQIEQVSTEEDAIETGPIYQDYSEIKNDIIEKKQEETITDVNVAGEEEILHDNILSDSDSQKDIVISTDIMSDSNDVQEDNLDYHEHIVMDELSVPVSSEVIDGDIDDASADSIGNEQSEVSSDETKINIIEANDDEQGDDSLPYFYDDSLVPADKLSIPEVYDVKEEKTINSRDFFSQNENELILWRRNLQEEYLMGHARFICPECKHPVKISGHKLARGRVCYFAHFKDSDDCSYKTGTHRTKEEIERLKYSLVQESDRHKRLKAAIETALKGERSMSKGVKNVECEKRIKSDIPYLNWRRPDIYAEYNGRKYVFELQLSTTFVSVVVDRDIFYRLNDYNIIWIFNFEDNAEYVNLHNLMCKDIYYANKRNVFIFDADAEKRSKEKGELILKCRWLDENEQWSSDQYVTLDKLQYDEENHKAFVYDADKVYLEIYPEIKTIRKQLEHTREYLLQGIINRLKAEEKIKEREQNEKDELRNLLLENNDKADIVEVQGKYGLFYKGNVLLSPEYTSIDKFDNDGFAKVYSGRFCGLATKDGRLVVPCEFKSIYVIDAKQELFFASYKTLCLFLNGTKYEIMDFDMKRDEITSEKTESIHTIILAKKGAYDRSRQEYAMNYYNLAHISKDYALLRGDGKFFGYDYNTRSPKVFDFKEMEFSPVDGIFIVSDGQSYGVATEEPSIILPLEYKSFSLVDKGVILQDIQGKYGYYTLFGQEILPCQYDTLTPNAASGLLIYKLDGLYGLLNVNGDKLTDNLYREISYDSEDSEFRAYVSRNRYVVLDTNGQIKESESKACHNNWVIKHSGNCSSIIEKDTNETILSYRFEFEEFATQRIKVVDDGSWYSQMYYIADEKGTKLSESYNAIEEFDGYSAQAKDYYATGNIDINGQKTKTLVRLNDQLFISHCFEKSWELQDAEGNNLFNTIFKKIEQLYPDGIILKIVNDTDGYYNECALFRDHQQSLNFGYRDIVPINDVYFKLERTDGTYELMKKKVPSYLLADNYKQLDCLYGDVFVVAQDDVDGKQIIKDTGEVLAHIKYDKIECIEDGFLKVCYNLKYGVIDVNGNVVIPVDFTHIGDFVDQSANAKIGDCEGMISLSGFQDASIVEDFNSYKLCVSIGRYFFSNDGVFRNQYMNFECVRHLKDHLFGVKQSLWGVYNALSGKMVINSYYSDIDNREDGYIEITKDGLCGIANDEGYIMIYPRYESISKFEQGQAEAIRNDHTGIITLDGRELYEIIESQYNWSLRCKFGEYSFVDSCNNSIFNFIINNLNKISDGFYLATNGDSDNYVVLNPNMRQHKTFRGNTKLLSSSYYAVYIYKKWYLYCGFEQIGDLGFDDIQPLSGHLFAVETISHTRSWYSWNRHVHWDVITASGNVFYHGLSEKPKLLSGTCYFGDGKLYRNGELLLENIGEIVKSTEDRFIIDIRNKGKVIVNDNGLTITKTEYLSISYNDELNNFTVATKPELQGIVDYNGNFSPDTVWQADSNEFQIVEHLGKIGVRNETGDFILPLSFNHVRLSYNLIKVLTANSTIFSIRKIGKELTSIDNVIELCVVSEDVILVKKNGNSGTYYYSDSARWGALNNNLEEIIPFEYVSLNKVDNNRLLATKVDGSIGTYDFEGNILIDRAQLIANLILTKRFVDYGLEDADGRELISLEEHCSEIIIVGTSYLRVRKEGLYALYDDKGAQLCEFIYSGITIDNDGVIHANLNGQKGVLDENGKEYVEFTPFNGGYICTSFGRYFVVDEAKTEIIIDKTSSKIELLDEDGIFILRDHGKIRLADKSKNITPITYDSAKNIGNGFFLVSRTATKQIKTRCIGYGYRGNPYTYYTTKYDSYVKYGVLDKNLKSVIPCSYRSISEFDSNNNLVAINYDGTEKVFSLDSLHSMTPKTIGLDSGNEYKAEIRHFMSVGVVVKIKDSTYIIHKKYLYKPMKDFAKGEFLMAKYVNSDPDGHPVWETSCCNQKSAEEQSE